MPLLFKKWNSAGIYYSAALLVVIAIIMLGAKIFNVADPTWALISGVVCTELEIDQVKFVVIFRILATVIGVVIASLITLIVGPGYLGIMLGVLMITLVCHYIIPLTNNWKLATATGVMVLVAAFQQHSVHFAEAVALKRAAEVIFGSLVAGIVSSQLIIFQKKFRS